MFNCNLLAKKFFDNENVIEILFNLFGSEQTLFVKNLIGEISYQLVNKNTLTIFENYMEKYPKKKNFNMGRPSGQSDAPKK
jgi:hypothetical protein